MRGWIFLCALVVASATPLELAPPTVGPSPSDTEIRYIPGSPRPAILARRTVLIKTDAQTIARIVSAYPVSVLSVIPRLSVYRLLVPEGQEDALAAVLAREPGVQYAEREPFYEPAEYPNDQFLSQQYHLSKIRAFTAWDTQKGLDGIAVAVIDTGVSLTHPDLSPRIASGGYDFVDNDNDASEERGTGQDRDGDGTPDKNVGHGTSVAGLIAAATNNLTGVAGITWAGLVLPVRIFPQDGSSSVEVVARGILWAAADTRVRVINLSLSGPSDSSVLRDAVQVAYQSGKLVVAAAGNYSSATPAYPAAYPEVVAVAALNCCSQSNMGSAKASFSNYGTWVDLSAPGSSLSTTDFTRTGQNQYKLNSFSGTSAASPVVAGVAMLIFSEHPDWTPDQVRTHLYLTARNIDAENPDYIGQLGAGIVDAQNAVTMGDVAPPRILSSTALSNTVALLSFDEPLDAASIQNGTASCGSTSLPVYSARLSSNPAQVEIFTASQAGGSTYALTCTGFKDLSGNISAQQSAEFVGTNRIRNFLSSQQGAVASRVDTIGSASFLNDGIPNNYFEFDLNQERAFEIKLETYQNLDTVVIRCGEIPVYYVLETGIQTAGLMEVASGYAWGDLAVSIPPNTIRIVRIRFPASPGSRLRIGEVEGYRRDLEPPALIQGPSISTLSDTEVQIGFIASEPVSGKLFYRPLGSASYLFVNLAPVAYQHMVTVGGLAPMTTYEWYLDLIDGWGNRLLYPQVDDGEAPLTFRASTQYLVTHQAPKPYAVISRSLGISITVTPAPVAVELFYSLPGGGFTGTAMAPSGTLYSASIPGSSVTSAGVAYHFVIHTNSGDFRYPSAGEFIVPATVQGDTNGDRTIDDRDLLEIGIALGQGIGDPTFSENLDVNGDGLISAQDLVALINLIPN
ncbi:MAG: S8 family serine peptidase [bacterium JZ-2024 1]